MKDHAVRVGNEAEFILNRARADDVKRQADAEMQHAQLIGATKREESACATLISAARRRDALQGSATARRALQALTNPSGCWHRAETDKGGAQKTLLLCQIRTQDLWIQPRKFVIANNLLASFEPGIVESKQKRLRLVMFDPGIFE